MEHLVKIVSQSLCWLLIYLLADENVYPDVIVFLREAGLDVKSVSEQGQFGLPDTQVLQRLKKDGNSLLLPSDG
jgi:hypothetical protein